MNSARIQGKRRGTQLGYRVRGKELSSDIQGKSRGTQLRHRVRAFGVMSFGIMSHSALCRIRTYVVWDCVLRRNVVRPTVGVS